VPERLGKWNSIYKRHPGGTRRWCEAGIWAKPHDYCVSDPDLEQVIIDSTVIRAHPCAAGAPKQRGGQAQQALGRSRGGFSTKIHLTLEALGNALRFVLTAGQCADSPQAEPLLADLLFARLIADKAYDTHHLRKLLATLGAEAVIPPKANRKTQFDYDSHLYKERHLVESFINKLKYYRRIFTRFDKLASRYLGFVQFASALIWLR
jgi:transposase